MAVWPLLLYHGWPPRDETIWRVWRERKRQVISVSGKDRDPLQGLRLVDS